MRAFFCLPLPVAVREAAAAAADRIRRETNIQASWVRLDNYHVTLRFLGDVEADWLPDIEQAAVRAARGVEPWVTPLARLGAFPDVARARVLWIGGEAPAGFLRVADALEEALSDLGFPREPSPTVAHVTLARVKSRPDVRLEGLLRSHSLWRPMQVPAEEIVLMQSELEPGGARYTPLCRIPIRKEPT